MLISKKDLLMETGISYGQLYRWKREGLIPEDWFLKQPSFTGQETFFPREKILNRIYSIQELKDRYSLEELSKILSPEISERRFTLEDLRQISEIDNALIPCFHRAFGEESFTFVQVLFLIAVSTCDRRFSLGLEQIESLCIGVREPLKTLRQTDYILMLLDGKDVYYLMLWQDSIHVVLDNRLKEVCSIRLDELSFMMKLKYRKSFGFHFEEQSEKKAKVKESEVLA